MDFDKDLGHQLELDIVIQVPVGRRVLTQNVHFEGRKASFLRLNTMNFEVMYRLNCCVNPARIARFSTSQCAFDLGQARVNWDRMRTLQRDCPLCTLCHTLRRGQSTNTHPIHADARLVHILGIYSISLSENALGTPQNGGLTPPA